jgi:hypothetical protein
MEGAITACSQDSSTDFSGGVPPNVRRFEDDVLARHFAGARLDAWVGDPAYHQYMNRSALGTTSMTAAWREYLHWPAPTIQGRRSEPVREGERSLAMAAPVGPSGIRVPLPGGIVTHYVAPEARALINATGRMHVLHPGYIVRWLEMWGPVIVSCTLGRGVGITPELNQVYGVRIFYELDQRIKASLGSR